MGYILVYWNEHEVGDLHYHIESDLGQKKVFTRFKDNLPRLLPGGFSIVNYGGKEDDIGILDEGKKQHMHIYYIQRRFPHNLHITFLQEGFRDVFMKMLRKLFPKAKISLRYLKNDEYTVEY